MPSSMVSGADVAAPFKDISAGIDAIGQSLEQAATPAQEAAGYQSVTRGPDGRLSAQTRPQLSNLDVAYNHGVQLGVAARASMDTVGQLGQMREAANGDPEAFRTAAQGFREKATAGLPPAIAQGVGTVVDREITSQYGGMVDQKIGNDIATASAGVVARQSYLTSQLGDLAVQGLTNSPQYRQLHNELDDLVTQRTKNPLFKYGPDQATLDRQTIEDKLTSAAYTGDVVRTYQKDGYSAAQARAQQIFETDTSIPEARRYKAVQDALTQVRSLYQAGSQVRREFAANRDIVASGLKDGSLSPDDPVVTDTLKQASALGDPVSMWQLSSARDRARLNGINSLPLHDRLNAIGTISGGAPAAASGGMVTIKTSTGQTAQVAAPYASNFQGFINDLEAAGYKVKSVGGYNPRNIAGTGTPSFHSVGAAIDINPEDNPEGPANKNNLPANVGMLAAKWGLGWGGNWTSKKDPMHFSAAKAEGGSFDVSRTGGAPAGPQVAGGSAIYQGILSRGYDPMHAAVLAGNMQQESNFVPGGALNKEGGMGLLQWRGDRLTALQNFASQRGGKPSDPAVQLDFMKYEMTDPSSPEHANAAAFFAATTPAEANAALKRYIRYGDNSEGQRLQYAQGFMGGNRAGPTVARGAGVAGTPPAMPPGTPQGYIFGGGILKDWRDSVTNGLTTTLAGADKTLGQDIPLDAGQKQDLVDAARVANRGDLYDKVVETLTRSDAIDAMHRMPVQGGAADAYIHALQAPGPVGEEAARAAQLKQAVDTHQRMTKMLADDPRQLGAQLKLFDPGPPVDFSQPDQAKAILSARGPQMQLLAQTEQSGPLSALTPGEIDGVKSSWLHADANQRMGIVGALASLPPDVGRATLMKLAANPETAGLAVAGALAKTSPETAAAVVRGQKVLETNPQFGFKADSSDYALARDSYFPSTALAPGMEQAWQGNLDAARWVYADISSRAGDSTGKFDEKRWNQAIDMVTGGIINWNGQKIVTPKPGVTGSRFDEVMAAVPESVIGNAVTPAGTPLTARFLRGGPAFSVPSDMIGGASIPGMSGGAFAVLHSSGDGRYQVELGKGTDTYALDKQTGKRFELDVRPYLDTPPPYGPADLLGQIGQGATRLFQRDLMGTSNSLFGTVPPGSPNVDPFNPPPEPARPPPPDPRDSTPGGRMRSMAPKR